MTRDLQEEERERERERDTGVTRTLPGVDAAPGTAPSTAVTMTLGLPTPTDFHFPFTPYAIQDDLMRQVFEAIEGGKVAVLESPTGTGKSLSIICAAFSWLRADAERSRVGEIEQLKRRLKAENPKDPDWVIEHAVKQHQQEIVSRDEDFMERLRVIKVKEVALKARQEMKEKGRFRKKPRLSESQDGGESDSEFLPDDYDSEQRSGAETSRGGPSAKEEDNISPEVRELMRRFETHSNSKEKPDETPARTKVIFASRTHTQLSQFTAEITKTFYADDAMMTGLASRRQLCINPDVRKLAKGPGGSEAVNERCLEMQKSGSKHGRCEFLPTMEEEHRMNDFRDHVLAKVRDIEDIARLGEEQGCCPFYGARKAVPQAELVVLPYPLLLQPSAREALSLDLTGQIIIVDEAHNLMDTIVSSGSAAITSTQLSTATQQIKTYLSKFRNRLKGSNEMYLKQVLKVLERLDEFCQLWAEKGSKKKDLTTPNEVLGALDQVNLLQLERYLKESKIARKISGYAEKCVERQLRDAAFKGGTSGSRGDARPPSTSAALSAISSMHQIEAMVLALANLSEDGRVLLSRDGKAKVDGRHQVLMRYQLLNPAAHFASVVEEARAIILIGGTMEPVSDFKFQLFPTVAPERFATFSCGHIIPPSHLLTEVVRVGPRGKQFNFRFDRRGDVEMADELGQAIVNVCNIVADGVVCFLPSYGVLDEMYNRWKTSGLLTRLEGKKAIFTEPKESSGVDVVLRDYASAIQSLKSGSRMGALLFAVVGGKLSEGINFSNELARAVIMVGLPYANLMSTELQERMRYARELQKRVGSSRNSVGSETERDAGMLLYENMCMRAVNQSIGRAIRNANDWAAILLFDARWLEGGRLGKLPKWLAGDVKKPDKFGTIIRDLAMFCKERRNAA